MAFHPARRTAWARSKFFSFPGRPCRRTNVGCGPAPEARYATPLMRTPPDGMCSTSMRAGWAESRGGSTAMACGVCAPRDEAASVTVAMQASVRMMGFEAWLDDRMACVPPTLRAAVANDTATNTYGPG